MKLKDLQPNQVIHIKTKKEAKAINKLARKQGISYYSNQLSSMTYPCALINSGDYLDWGNIEWYEQRQYSVLPASQFLKKTNKKRIKVLEIQMGEQMDQVDSLTHVVQTLSRYIFESAGLGNPKDFNIESLSDALSYVKKDVSDPEKPLELEDTDENVGKWYKNEKNGAIVFLKEYGYDNYGFQPDGQFVTRVHMSKDGGLNWGYAEKGEVESALIEEAKRRGFVDGSRIKSDFELWSNKNRLFKGETDIDDDYRFKECENELLAFGVLVFQNGKWAEIISQPEQVKKLRQLPDNWFCNTHIGYISNNGWHGSHRPDMGIEIKEQELKDITQANQ